MLPTVQSGKPKSSTDHGGSNKYRRIGVVYIMEKFSILKNIITFLPVGNVYIYLLPIGLAMGIGIGFLGSYFTVRKHLRV